MGRTFAAETCYNPLFLQIIRRPDSLYMEGIQQDISQTMRGILVDWLVEVRKFFSHPEIMCFKRAMCLYGT